MVSTVQQRRGQADSGNDGDEANAGAAGVEREALSFSSADVQAFFAQHEVSAALALRHPATRTGVRLRPCTHALGVLCVQAEQTQLFAKQTQALNYDFRKERALDGDWQWEPISADGACCVTPLRHCTEPLRQCVLSAFLGPNHQDLRLAAPTPP
jgi:hypothetical protein